MNTTRTTSIDPGCRIQLPLEWAEALGLKDQVALVMTAEGISVHTATSVTWDDIFASRLSIRRATRPLRPRSRRSAGMISSSSHPLDLGLDTMILVYGLLHEHPARAACEQMLRSHTGWILRRVHDWISRSDPRTAQDFWSHIGAGSHLP